MCTASMHQLKRVQFFAGKTMTDDCKKELAQFRIELGESINRNLPLGEQCLHLPFSRCSGRQLILTVSSPKLAPCAQTFLHSVLAS